ncbi:MAG: DUF2764 domain-containing protein [Candidatus Omnitrophica bacterium]|nr:DUF2764 domain-containing protein [Candidatus Omnitrophota bacterium]MCF7877938.1 DUF2764 domain-containing protein [Candidatus Omnitrophota bacterium]MCF7893401.1 DUF2764 domain-containing protein [Candidatus Omnitrophota bacterium]
MDKYYYLIAQLPLLKFGEQTYLDKNLFLEEAKKWLSEEEFVKLKEAGIDDLEKRGKTSFVKEYKEFELALRESLAAYRESKKNRQEYQAGPVLDKKLLQGNPLEVEKKLFLYRWQKVGHLSQGNIFNLEAVIAYFLKLQILEKVLSFDKEEGTKKFDSLTEVEDEKIR